MVDDAIRSGHYAANQLFGRSAIISWSHRKRFEFGLRLIRQLNARRLLDYGCGDGTLLAMLQDTAARPESCTGAEIETKVVEDCRRRFGHLANVRFLEVPALASPEYQGHFDVVVCTEVLEHVVELEEVIQKLRMLLADGGKLVISVPVEVGLPVLFKQTVRRIAGWRGVGDYKWTSRYAAREMWASVFAGEEQHIPRQPYRNEDGSQSYDHKGFNWRHLRALLRHSFDVERVVASPLRALGPNFASQVWFVATKRPA